MAAYTTEARAKIAAANRARVVSIETRAKMAAAHTGLKHTLEARARISARNIGKVMSQTSRAKMSVSARSRARMTRSPEARARISVGIKGAEPIGECIYCFGPATTRDHVIPRGRPGWDDPDNLVPCCRACNAQKWQRTPEEWFAAQGPRVRCRKADAAA